MTIQQFQNHVLKFYRKYSRKDLSWRKTSNPWAILVSEVMLQQTQVARVKEKFGKFLKRFPTPKSLACASKREVLTYWQGLGYNRRALNLQKVAQEIVGKFGGKVPSTPGELDSLPGIGQYTANAVCAFAFNKPVVFLDTNIRRVFLYHYFSQNHKITKSKNVVIARHCEAISFGAFD